MSRPLALILSSALLSGASILSASGVAADGRRPVEQLAACGSGKTVTVRISENGNTVRATVGDRIRIELPVTSGTGYSWQLKPAGTAALATDGAIAAARPGGAEGGRPGGPVVQTFALRAAAVGAQTLMFDYLRPWEAGKPPARSFAVTITVGGC